MATTPKFFVLYCAFTSLYSIGSSCPIELKLVSVGLKILRIRLGSAILCRSNCRSNSYLSILLLLSSLLLIIFVVPSRFLFGCWISSGVSCYYFKIHSDHCYYLAWLLIYIVSTHLTHSLTYLHYRYYYLFISLRFDDSIDTQRNITLISALIHRFCLTSPLPRIAIHFSTSRSLFASFRVLFHWLTCYRTHPHPPIQGLNWYITTAIVLQRSVSGRHSCHSTRENLPIYLG
jgi:hypothetical protein